MADTGKLVTKGLHAGAIKYLALKGLVQNPGGVSLNACYVTRGLGITNRHKVVLRGLSTNPGSSGGGGFCIFGGSILTGTPVDGWL